MAGLPRGRKDQAGLGVFVLHAGHGHLMVHAGLDPHWGADEALALAAEARAALAEPEAAAFLAGPMYGDAPEAWDPGLAGDDRLRFLINTFTRLRVCDDRGRARYDAKGPPGEAPEGCRPWFAVPGRRSAGTPVLFGHWSLLGRVHWPEHAVWGLDTGCVWGGPLTALRLEDGHLASVPGLDRDPAGRS